MTKYLISGKEENLTDSHFLYEGGEGKIFAKGQLVYKIYLDPSRMIPLEKMKELSLIRNPHVITPIDVIKDIKKRKVGFTMQFVKDTYPLCRVFTLSFKKKQRITDAMILALIIKKQQIVQSIHRKNILIVDYNEMNCLLNKTFDNIFFIDTDSYQTPSFPATAIMDSIRDRHSKQFSELTDWFSFAILTFQMFTNIHPYKGKHPSIKSLDDRMEQNLSVFHKDVSVPKMCPPFNIIPQGYRKWFHALFEDGKRCPPPSDPQEMITISITAKVLTSNQKLNIEKINTYTSDIISYTYTCNHEVIITENEIRIDNKSISLRKDVYVTFATDEYIPFVATIKKDSLFFENIVVNHCIGAQQLMTYEGRLYVKGSGCIGQVTFIKTNKSFLATARTVANILPNATKLYEGVAIQNLLGTWAASIFPESNKSFQIVLEELKGYKVIDAKYDNYVLIIIAHKKGKYNKFIFKFVSDFKTHTTRKIEDVDYQSINFVVLDNGIVVHMNENEELEIFSNRTNKNDLKIIKNDDINGNMKLFKKGTTLLLSERKTLYKVNMK